MNAPIERMKKILELARRGVDGEKETAESMLRKMLVKYGLTIADLEDQAPAKRYVTYKFRGEPECRLLMQIVGAVTNSRQVENWRHRVKSEVSFELTAVQQIEVDVRFEAYRPALAEAIKKAVDCALTALIQTNDIFPDDDDADDTPGKPFNMAEMEALVAMMRTMTPTPVVRMLEGEADGA